MTAPAGRSWGYWTRVKLGMLGEYLGGFATASKGQAERVYLDAFAGEGSGLDRLTGEQFPGSARIALEAGERAGFTRFRFFELSRRAAELEAQLRADYPNRDIVLSIRSGIVRPNSLAVAISWGRERRFVVISNVATDG